MASSAPPLEIVTANDHGAQVSLVNCIFIVFSGLAVIVRGLSRARVAKLNNIDDFATLLALVFAIGQAVCIELAVNNGLGRRRSLVSASEFLAYSKYQYDGQILLVLVLACAKFAVTHLILSIQPKRFVRLATYGVDITIGLWTVTSIFALAFQCKLPRPWLLTSVRCVNLRALYDYVVIMNIITDVALVILPVILMWKVQLPLAKKTYVVSLFGARIIVPAVSIAQLIYLQSFLDSLDSDQTWDSTIPALLNALVMNLSIITACIPSLGRMAAELQTRQTGLKVSEHLELSVGRSTNSAQGGHFKKATSTNKTTGTDTSSSSKSQTTANASRVSARRPPPNEAVTSHAGSRFDPRGLGVKSMFSSSRSRDRRSGDHHTTTKDDDDDGVTTSSQERLRREESLNNGITYTIGYSVEDDEHSTMTPSRATSQEHHPHPLQHHHHHQNSYQSRPQHVESSRI